MSDETRLSEAELSKVERMASGWVFDPGTGQRIQREDAIGEEMLAFYALDLIAEVRAYRALFTPEWVEALDKLRHDIFRCSDYFVEADWYEQARDVLDRLLANGGAK